MTIHQDPHPREGQTMILSSPTPELDGRAAMIGRRVQLTDLKTTVKHSNDFLRRSYGLTPLNPNDIFQITLVPGPNDPSMSPGFNPDYRHNNAIWVLGEEITDVPFNKHTRNTKKRDVESYLKDPKTCLYSNCTSDSLTIVGIGLRNGDIQTKIECSVCFGEWREQWGLVGIKENSDGK